MSDIPDQELREKRQALEDLQLARNELESSVRIRTAELENANKALKAEIDGRREIEENLRRAHDELDKSITERTGELAKTINVLQGEISERQAAEERIRRINRLYAALSATNEAIVHSSDQSTLFQEICRVAVEQGGFRMAWVGITDEATGMVMPVAWSGWTEGYLDGIRISIRVEPQGLGPTGSAIRDGNLRICSDTLTESCALPWSKEMAKRGYRSSAAVPLKLDGKPVGALTIYAGEKEFFNDDLVELLQQMAADISFALDNFDREQRRREAERALQEEIQERLATTEALREKERMLIQQSRLAALGEMINNISHQWRQPLNNVGLIVQELPVMYEMGQFSQEYLQARVDKIKEVIFHMSKTIDDFRNFFRPDKAKVLFTVNRAVAQTLSIIEESLRNQQIRVSVDASGDPVINGYPNEYSQVLINILLNARDAFLGQTPGDPRLIKIRSFREEDRTVVTIADNAGGIPEEVIDKIFDPYFTTKGPDKGTGVGLYMAKSIIVNNMNGALSVRNTGDGAEFRIEV